MKDIERIQKTSEERLLKTQTNLNLKPIEPSRKPRPFRFKKGAWEKSQKRRKRMENNENLTLQSSTEIENSNCSKVYGVRDGNLLCKMVNQN